MRIPFWSRFAGRSRPALHTGERWRNLLRAAGSAPFYAPHTKALREAARASTEEDRRQALLGLPEVELDYFFQHSRHFMPAAQTASMSELHPLWPGESRVAAVSPWFQTGPRARLFLHPDAAALSRFAPEVIAAPVDTLLALAARGDWSADSPLFALVALTGIGTPLLTPSLRDSLWQAFGVPIYVQFRGFQGEWLAGECEAHHGLHGHADGALIERRASGELMVTSLSNLRHTVLRLATRLHAWLDMRECGCGRTATRLMHLQHLPNAAMASAPTGLASLSALAAAAGASRSPHAAAPPVAREHEPSY